METKNMMSHSRAVTGTPRKEKDLWFHIKYVQF